ncbi:MAG TPA: hypothetical protein PKE69_01970, partial [Pyrinomonadaceae bacterium]|nr:hypothetical protein [Pyrinomonadaceae bacterium]
MKKLLSVFFAIISLSAIVSAHVPIKTLVQIVRAEDELRFDKTLETLMKSPDAHIRTRAALAAERIGVAQAREEGVRPVDRREVVAAHVARGLREEAAG